MAGMVRRPDRLGPPAGQRLALIAAGKEGELARMALPEPAEPAGGGGERLLPLDLLELAAAALADAQQRLLQPRRRVLLHDAGRALGAEHALVDRVVAVALDVADAAILEMDLDAAAAGAHVAGRVLDLIVAR